jgi:hypothetical protein
MGTRLSLHIICLRCHAEPFIVLKFRSGRKHIELPISYMCLFFLMTSKFANLLLMFSDSSFPTNKTPPSQWADNPSGCEEAAGRGLPC